MSKDRIERAKIVAVSGNFADVTKDGTTILRRIPVVGDATQLVSGQTVHIVYSDGRPTVTTRGTSSGTGFSLARISGGGGMSPHSLEYHTNENEWHAALTGTTLHNPKPHAIDSVYHTALNTSTFDTLLSGADSDVQKALNTLDDHNHHDLYWRANCIILMSTTWSTYEKTIAGLVAALTAATTGDTVWIPPGTYTGDITIPEGVIVQGANFNQSIINGQVAFAGNGWLTDCSIVINKDDANNYTGVLASDVEFAVGYLNRVFIYVNNAGAGEGYGIVVWGRQGSIEGDYCPLIFGSSQDAVF